MKILVTGSNGFLGRHVVAALCRRGHSVRALDRQAADVQSLGWIGLGVEQICADLCDGTGLAQALEGVDAVIHLAAQLRGESQAVITNTVEGTRRLVAAMRGSPVRRLVLASSLSVYDWSRIEGELNEDSLLESDIGARDAYAIAKFGQEQIVRELLSDRAWSVTILRPGALWGLGLDYPSIIGQKIGPLHMVFGPHRPLPMTHVENCADAFATVVNHGKASGEIFNVIDNTALEAWDYLGDCLKRSGRGGFRVPVPYGLAACFVSAAHPLARLVLRDRVPSILVPRRFAARFKPLRFSGRKMAELLGWAPLLGYEECLNRTHGPLTIVRAETAGQGIA